MAPRVLTRPQRTRKRQRRKRRASTAQHLATRIPKQTISRNAGRSGNSCCTSPRANVFGTIPAIGKLYYKDSGNSTVKGFDCVHIIDAPKSLELWLGEVKFYESVTHAITDVVKELEAPTQHDYLRREFAAIITKTVGRELSR